MEEYRPVVNTLPEVAQLLLGQERHCQGLLDVLQPDQTQGPQVISVCGAPGAGASMSQDHKSNCGCALDGTLQTTHESVFAPTLLWKFKGTCHVRSLTRAVDLLHLSSGCQPLRARLL